MYKSQLESTLIRVKKTVNKKLTKYKVKNKLNSDSEAVERLLANDSLRSHIAEEPITRPSWDNF